MWRLIFIWLVLFAALVGCASPKPQTDVVSPTDEETAASAGSLVAAAALLDNVTVQQGGAQRPLLLNESAELQVGDSIDVDEAGRATLQFEDLLVVEVMRDGELIVQELSLTDSDAIATFSQIGGAVLNDFNAEEAVNRRLTIETEFATITATGTRFLIAKELNTPLEWIVGLDASPGDLMITADGVTKEVTTDVGRWVAPIGEPSPSFGADMTAVGGWLENLREGKKVEEIGEVLWSPADLLADMSGAPVNLGAGSAVNMQGVGLALDPAGEYSMRDCNGDGIDDLFVRRGVLRFDLRPMISRVRAFDATIINGGGPGSATLVGYNPGGPEEQYAIAQDVAQAAAVVQEILSLRSAEQPFHFASLTLENGCFLGFSLTPPKADGSFGNPRAVAEGVSPAPTPLVAAPTAPLLIAPKADEALACPTAAGPFTVGVTWQAATSAVGIVGYEVENEYVDMAANGAERSFAYQVGGDVTRFGLPVPCSAQKIRWRVRALDVDGRVGEWSAWQSFSLIAPTPSAAADTTPPPAPRLISPNNAYDPKNGGHHMACRSAITLEWEAVKDESDILAYEVAVQAAQTRGGDDWVAVGRDVSRSGTKIAFNYKPGIDYRWRVRAADGAQNIGPWSEWGHFLCNS